MIDYFDYEEIFEVPDDELWALMEERKKEKRSFLLCAAPHGVLSYTALCAVASSDTRFGGLSTAVAGVVLKTPFIKHIIGIYGMVDASRKSMLKHFARGGAEGSLVLYTGGIAELFFCSRPEETLFLKERKGFVKLALTTVT
jgi:diacylglycerol O-acyltransferase 2-like protein 6